MPKAFNCPACGAPLPVELGMAVSMRCLYCSSTVSVPVEFLDQGSPAAVSAKAAIAAAAQAKVNHADFVAALTPRVRAGEKIQAIRIYKDHYGVGLKEAKEAVEVIIERGLQENLLPERLPKKLPLTKEKDDNDVLGEAADLIARGQKIDAIRLLRERFDISLKLAKQAAVLLEQGKEVDIEWLRMTVAQQNATAIISNGSVQALDEGQNQSNRFMKRLMLRIILTIVVLVILFNIAIAVIASLF